MQSNKYAIILTFLALWITSFFSFEYQQSLGFVIIFLFGILHGSNDLQLIFKINVDKNSPNYRKILGYYILFVSTGITMFLYLPVMALLLFIFLSAYHFGEQHWKLWEQKKHSLTKILFLTVYGLFILSLLFYFHQKEVQKIIEQITKISIVQFNFSIATLILGILLSILGVIVTKRNSNFKNEILINIFYLILFSVLFNNANLIWSFAIYFVIWHSVPSIEEQVIFLYGRYTFQNFKKYLKTAFVYWMISLIGIGLLYVFLKNESLFNAVFFAFLAAITFPHTIVIIQMNNSKK